jgi:hypothetical protein
MSARTTGYVFGTPPRATRRSAAVVVTGLAAAVRRMTSKAIADTGLDTEPGGATKPFEEMVSLRGFEPLLPP